MHGRFPHADSDGTSPFALSQFASKDIFSLKISHFAALILRVDIQTKVLYFQDFSKISGQGTKISEHSDRLLAQKFETGRSVSGRLASGRQLQLKRKNIKDHLRRQCPYPPRLISNSHFAKLAECFAKTRTSKIQYIITYSDTYMSIYSHI